MVLKNTNLNFTSLLISVFYVSRVKYEVMFNPIVLVIYMTLIYP